MQLINFLIGGIYTIAVIALAFTVGLYVGARAEPELFNELTRSFKRPKKKLESGPVKPLSKIEREAKQYEPIRKFVEKL